MQENKELSILNVEEENVNSIMFIAWVLLTVVAFIVVVGFLDGSLKDGVALGVTAVGIVIRLLEKKKVWFKKYAKYAYMTLPVWCTIVLVLDNEGRFAAVTQAYFFYLALSIAYCDVKMVFWCASITMVSTIVAIVFFPEAMFNLDTPIVWLYIFLIYIAAIYFCAVIANRMRNLLEKTRQMKNYEDELVYLEQLEKKEENHSEFIHNINHYFIAIKELARVEHCDQIVDLVQELNGKMHLNERIIYTNYRVLNAILAEKSSESKEKQIEFDVYVEPMLKLEGIADCDLVAMVGNLIDNALEAAVKCESDKRRISIKIFMEREGKVCVMKIVNNFVTQPVRRKKGFISTKKNSDMHGIGVKSVEKTAKKYGGNLQCLTENDKFTAILFLNTKN